MILIDTALRQRAAQERPLKIALVGAGFMAHGVANQIVNSVPGMELVVIANRTLAKARSAFSEAGIREVTVAGSRRELEDCVHAGRPAITEDAFLVAEPDAVDVLVELTGAVDFGAQIALHAFRHGTHVVSMNAELEATLGAVLQHHARRAGVIFSLSDGDQPGVEMNLWRQVRAMGLQPLVCGNIKGLQDAYRNPATQRAFAEKWGQNPYMVTSFADGSKISFEQACVANATGMRVEQRGMRGGDFEGHVDELCHNGRYEIDRLRQLGGVVDYVVKTRPGPGVFVLAAHDDARQRHMLNLYKLGEGPLYSFYTPYHLCHFEVPFSVARVALFGDRVLAAERPMVDVITKAKRPLQAGEPLDAIGGYDTYGECENHEAAAAGQLLPQGLAEGCVLKRDLPKDAAISYRDVTLPEGRLCDQLRSEQDSLFAASGPSAAAVRRSA